MSSGWRNDVGTVRNRRSAPGCHLRRTTFVRWSFQRATLGVNRGRYEVMSSPRSPADKRIGDPLPTDRRSEPVPGIDAHIVR